MEGTGIPEGRPLMTLLIDSDRQYDHLEPVCVRTSDDVFVCRIVPMEKRSLPGFQDQVATGPFGYSRFKTMLDPETCGRLEQAVGLYRTRKRSRGG